MTNIHLEQIRRRLKLNTPAPEQPPPAPTSDLGAAIEQLIRQAAAAGADAAVEKQQKPVNQAVPVHRREFTDKAESHEFPGPPAHTAPPKDLTVSLQRDAAGKPIYAQVGNVKFEIQRNSDGRITRMVQVDDAPTLPPPPIPYKADARKYNPGEER